MPVDISHQLSDVEIIVVGYELLNGTTLDTNSQWLSTQLENIGRTVSWKTTVPDEIASISIAIRESLRRKPDWIISVGGLGPTFDDLTLQGVSAALGKSIERNLTALNSLKESYRRRGLNFRLSRSCLKMAELPEGSAVLANPIGSSPGALLKLHGTTIISLPGVPLEMKSMFKKHLLPLLRSGSSEYRKRKQVWIRSVGVRESDIASFVKNVVKNHSEKVYVKSHPLGFDGRHRSILDFQLIALDRSSEDDETLQKISPSLQRAILKLGGRIRSVRSI